MGTIRYIKKQLNLPIMDKLVEFNGTNLHCPESSQDEHEDDDKDPEELSHQRLVREEDVDDALR
jgi:hypothetical protein